MGVPTSTFQTYQAVGNREDLTDMLTNISPVENWFTKNTGDASAQAVYHEWQSDALASPAANAFIEGDDATNVAITPTTRLGNYVQTMRKVFQISDIQEIVNKAGRASEEAYQTTKKMKELANDTEYALLINSAAASGASGTARQMKGALGFVATNTATGAATAAASAKEGLFNDVLQLMWAAGAKPQHALMGSARKEDVDSFTGNNTKYINMKEAELQTAVEVYRTSYGNIALHLNHIMNAAATGTILVLGDMGLWRKAWLKKPMKEKLARTGSSNKFMIEQSLTLECGEEKGAGKLVLS